MPTSQDAIRSFLRRHKLAVEATHGPTAPQAAVIGIATTDDLEIVFDTLGTTRKMQNLRRDGRVALVVGWSLDEARTLQIEGIADEPAGADLDRLRAFYLQHFPDGVQRQAWPHLTYVRVRPTWIRDSDFSGAEPTITELVPIGSTWDRGRAVLETRLSGPVALDDVTRWKAGLVAELARVPDDTTFKLLVDLRGFAPASLEVHKAMREVVPRLLATHGMRPAFIDLFDERPELPIATDRGVVCIACANVHHDQDKMAGYQQRIGRPDQGFFSDRVAAESWLDQRQAHAPAFSS